MNIDIRNHIKNNFKNNSKKNIKEAIELSIIEKDEITLPGMGVLFEILWEDSKNVEKERILEILENYFKN